MKLLARCALIGAAAGLVLGPASVAAAASPSRPVGPPPFPQPPSVFVQTNNPAGNQVIVFARQANGQLSEEQVVSTGGLGGASAAASNLASEGSLTYDPVHRLLFAVNAGSDTISVLSVDGSHVRLDEVLPSGGSSPTASPCTATWSTSSMPAALARCRGSTSSGPSSSRSRPRPDHWAWTTLTRRASTPVPARSASALTALSFWSPPRRAPTRSMSFGSVRTGFSPPCRQ